MSFVVRNSKIFGLVCLQKTRVFFKSSLSHAHSIQMASFFPVSFELPKLQQSSTSKNRLYSKLFLFLKMNKQNNCIMRQSSCGFMCILAINIFVYYFFRWEGFSIGFLLSRVLNNAVNFFAHNLQTLVTQKVKYVFIFRPYFLPCLFLFAFGFIKKPAGIYSEIRGPREQRCFLFPKHIMSIF